MPAGMKVRWQLGRDVLLLLSGIGIAAHETLIAVEPRASLLLLACGMMGLPAALLTDRRLVMAAQPPSLPPPDSTTTP